MGGDRLKNIDKTPQEYSQMIQKYRQDKPRVGNFIRAYLMGGAICAIGQIIIQTLISFGMSPDEASPTASIILILTGSLLTGFGLYDELGQLGGAGAAVPITGFANAVVSPAMEFKSEGWILGVGAKMYAVAGPVLTYGMVSAFFVGLLKMIFSL